MTDVDITKQVADLAAALKSAAATGLNGVSVPCSPADVNKALKASAGIAFPSAVSDWVTEATQGLGLIASSVSRNPDATMSDATADELVTGWLNSAGTLSRAIEIIGCLSTMVEGTLKLDPVPDAPTTGLQPLIDALRSVPTPEWTSLAPALISPADGSVLSDYPRTLTMRWQRIPLAVSYQVAVEYCDDAACATTHPLTSESVTATEATAEFIGAQPGRWRVAAVDAHGTQASWSPWSHFAYTV